MREPIELSVLTLPKLRCAACRNWELTTMRALPDGEAMGQCVRFGEVRRGGARPRCNICWEPVPSLRVVEPPCTAQE